MADMILACPVCGERLAITGRSYTCPARHCFDMAKSGYVNLLLSKHIGKAVHGDNRLMVQARRDFLEKGYYSSLRDAVCRQAVKLLPEGGTVLDAGCGEGYYTQGIKSAFDEAVIPVDMYGIDISKTAAEFAAKRRCGVTFAAASVFHLPVMGSSCDMLITMFAPYAGEEFRRVLRPGGRMIMAIPSEEHLWELKQAVYDTPYRNEVKGYELEGFEFIGSERVTFNMELGSQEDIQSLFSMTPYYYRTGKAEQQRLAALPSLTVKADFEVLTYRTIS